MAHTLVELADLATSVNGTERIEDPPCADLTEHVLGVDMG